MLACTFSTYVFFMLSDKQLSIYDALVCDQIIDLKRMLPSTFYSMDMHLTLKVFIPY